MTYTEGTWTSTACTDVMTVTFTATDECGLTANTSFTFTITDTTPPVISGGANGTAECTGSDPSLNAAYQHGAIHSAVSRLPICAEQLL